MYRAARRSVFACSRWPRNIVQLRAIYPTRQSLTPLRSFIKPSPHNLVDRGGLAGLQSPQLRDDTIYALSTAEGKAGIAVIRISGPLCKSVGCTQPLLTTMTDEF